MRQLEEIGRQHIYFGTTTRTNRTSVQSLHSFQVMRCLSHGSLRAREVTSDHLCAFLVIYNGLILCIFLHVFTIIISE